MHALWFVAIAAVLCGCAEEKSEVIDQQPLAPPGVFAPLPPAVQNPLFPKAGVGAMTAGGVKLAIETSGLTYRIRISPGTNTVEYDQRSFQPPTPGLCPRGAGAYLKTKQDEYISCSGTEKGYSSASMSSQISFPPTNINYISLSGTNDFVSKSYEVPEILWGIGMCAPVKSIHKIKLGFRVELRVNGDEREYAAETDWSLASPELIDVLKKGYSK